MDGLSLSNQVRELLNEPVNSTFMNQRTTYEFLYAGVCDFNSRTHFLTETQVITMSGTNTYPLNPDYGGLALLDRYNSPIVQFTDSSGNVSTVPYMRSKSVV